MRNPKRTRTTTQLNAATEALAREWVNRWIEDGMLTADMRLRADIVHESLWSFMRRDIRTFAETGKYPEYAS